MEAYGAPPEGRGAHAGQGRSNEMTPLRVLVLCVGLVIALAPMAAVAADDTDHMAAELANASAQYQLALQQADDINAETELNMANDRMIALLQSQALRQHQLDGTANGNAIERSEEHTS